MIEVSELRLVAGQRELFERLDFLVHEGEFVAVLGANGVGKSTLLRALAGVSAPSEGSIRLRQREIGSLSASERARSLAYIAAEEFFDDRLTVREVVATGRYAHHSWWQWMQTAEDENAIASALHETRTQSFADRIFVTLSSGERQRVWIALALAQEADLLLLDEPTSHLDLHVAQEILSLLRRQAARGKTIVTVLHDPNEAAAFADRVLLLSPGHMLAFTQTSAALAPDLLELAYGVPMEQVRTGSGAVRVFAQAPSTSRTTAGPDLLPPG